MINIGKLKSTVVQKYRGQWWLDVLMEMYDLLSLPSWVIDKRAKMSRRKLRRLKDKYKGERCFILGNGPSLAKTDLSLLRNEYTFGLN